MGLRRITCIALLAGACGGGGSSDKPFEVVAQDQPSALLSVWASSDSDVWVVGGERGDMSGATVEHYDGTMWTKYDDGVRNIDLWWVKGFEGGPVFIGGANGTILSVQNGVFTQMPTPGTLVVFGIWGPAPNDVWAVGGNYGGGSGAFIWHYDGSMWTARTDVPADLVTGGTCWKVYGTASNDVWFGCTNGQTVHWDGNALSEVPVPAAQAEQASLFSVAGNSKGFVAVGGMTDGVLVENDGSGWVSKIPPGASPLTGVSVSEDDGYAVGQFGTILRRQNGKWSAVNTTATMQNLHAVFIDPVGGVWAVGGQFDQPLMTKSGVLLHKGDALQGSFQ